MQKFWLFLYKHAVRRLVQNGKARRYTVQELNAVLAVMRNRDVLVMQDGSIIAVESAS